MLFLCLPGIAVDTVEVSYTVKLIIGDGERTDYDIRYKAINNLSKSMQLRDVAHFVAFLSKLPVDDKLKQSALATIKNNLADKLLAQTRFPDGLLEAFVKLVDDPKQGIIWRDYVLQKYPELLRWLHTLEDRKLIIAKLWKMTETKDKTFAGTALLGLMRLSKVNNEEANPEKLGKQALKVADDDTFSLASRITALQVSAMLGERGALPVARRIAGSKGEVMIRVSALAALGILGDYSDIVLLEQYKKGSEYRLRRAAQSALDKIHKRNS